ncbi:pentatricopeptide repeat-containing protein [Carex littledalei]|uniref:Pentatricopeptide repeat-containing protein n=1 Tax=Carex littledalei TaxID=544730 RepID=A0A833QQQ8_9POAL|nr:pentatricopeptide repeat-containing protein [Carex littledalei]
MIFVSVFLCNVVLKHALKGQDLLRVWYKLRKESTEKDSCGAEMNNLPRNQSAGRLLLEHLITDFSVGINMRKNLDQAVEQFETYFPVNLYTYNMLLRVFAMGEDGPCM